MRAEIHNGDCIDVMRGLAPASVDAVVCDPPYELAFMDKTWDASGVTFRPETWAEVFRVLKPGGRLLAFGGTRTYHRMVCAIEDGGFLIEDCIMWVYGQGFPKHKSKLKPAYEPIVVARKGGASHLNVDACRIATDETMTSGRHIQANRTYPSGYRDVNRTEYEQNPAGRWPANVIMDEEAGAELDRMSGEGKSPQTYTRATRSVNVNAYGAGIGEQAGAVSLNYGDSGGASRFFLTIKRDADNDSSTQPIEAICGEESIKGVNMLAGKRAASNDGNSFTAGCGNDTTGQSQTGTKSTTETTTRSTTTCPTCNSSRGRNTTDSTPTSAQTTPLLTGLSTAAASDAESTDPSPSSKSGRRARTKATAPTVSVCTCKSGEPPTANTTTPTCESTADVTSSSRFFYCPKASRKERGEGNNHPTVKPLALMRYLCRLITPPDGLVLDPFCGSGTTGAAAVSEGFNFIGIEREAGYADIARRRIAAALQALPLFAGANENGAVVEATAPSSESGNADSIPPPVTSGNSRSVAQAAAVHQL